MGQLQSETPPPPPQYCYGVLMGRLHSETTPPNTAIGSQQCSTREPPQYPYGVPTAQPQLGTPPHPSPPSAVGRPRNGLSLPFHCPERARPRVGTCGGSQWGGSNRARSPPHTTTVPQSEPLLQYHYAVLTVQPRSETPPVPLWGPDSAAPTGAPPYPYGVPMVQPQLDPPQYPYEAPTVQPQSPHGVSAPRWGSTGAIHTADPPQRAHTAQPTTPTGFPRANPSLGPPHTVPAVQPHSLSGGLSAPRSPHAAFHPQRPPTHAHCPPPPSTCTPHPGTPPRPAPSMTSLRDDVTLPSGHSARPRPLHAAVTSRRTDVPPRPRAPPWSSR